MTSDLRLITDAATEVAPMPEFAEAMSALANGVVLVTCRLGARPWGVTVTAFASVSADPPTVLVSLRSDGTTARAIADTRSFGVSLLAAEQQAVAHYGSALGAPKFLEPFVDAGDELGMSPVVAGALAHLDCGLVDDVRIADHTVLFGRVRAAQASSGGTPLLYQGRAYRTLAEPARPHLPNGRTLKCLSS